MNQTIKLDNCIKLQYDSKGRRLGYVSTFAEIDLLTKQVLSLSFLYHKTLTLENTLTFYSYEELKEHLNSIEKSLDESTTDNSE